MPEPKPPNSDDMRWMRGALLLARYGLGRTAPNPSVGCVIVKDGKLIGRGRTADGGRPHAETQAILSADVSLKGATAYITLEPCIHHGETPPCTDALIKAGIKRVVIAALDPDPNVAGGGVAQLEANGITVVLGVCKAAAEVLLAGYFTHRRIGRPLVTVKIASSLDGRIALNDGRSQWITGGRTRDFVHLLRSQHDAVMTASGTVRADDPRLTCRIMGYAAKQPLRVVVASRFNLDDTSTLAETADEGTVAIFACDEGGGKAAPIGIKTHQIAANIDGKPCLDAVLQRLGEMGMTSVLVEAGGRFIASLLKAGLVDRLIWTRSSGVIGGDGTASLADLGLDNLSDGRMFSRMKSITIDDDSIEIFKRR